MDDIIDDKKETSLIEEKPERKSLSDIDVDDIKLTLDHSKSYEEQAEDVISAMATASAVQDIKTAQNIADKKAEELKAKADEKLKKAQTNQTVAIAYSVKQKAKRK